MASGTRLVAAPILDARFLHQPSTVRGTIAFVSDGELWTVPIAGGIATKVTNDGRPKSGPHISPDGRRLAYSAAGADGRDVYVTSLADHKTTRVTWHPADDGVEGWSHDGTQLLLTSTRAHPFGAFGHSELFEVPASGGNPTPIPIGKAYRAAISPDGGSIAYTPTKDVFGTWRRYRGGQAATIWITKLSDYSHIEVPMANANNTNPVWIGGTLYFLSDRSGSFGIYAYDPVSRHVTAVMTDAAHNIDWLTGDRDNLVFEDAGYLWRYDLAKGKTEHIRITLPDGPRQKIRSDVTALIGSMALDPDGKRVVVEARGDLILVDGTGTQLNLTHSSAAAERDPVWSPDGKLIAYVSDEDGEYALRARSPVAGASARSLGLWGRGFPHELTWSPDSSRIAYIAYDRGVAWVEVATGQHRHVDAQVINDSPLIWTRDGKGLFFIDQASSNYGQVRYVDTASGLSAAITDAMAHASDISIDASGQALMIVASLDAGPTVSGMDASVALFTPTVRSMVYAVNVEAAVSFARQTKVAANAALPELRPEPKTAGSYPVAGGNADLGLGRAILSTAKGTLLTLQHPAAVEPYFDWYATRDHSDDLAAGSGGASVDKPQWSFIRYAQIDDALELANDHDAAPPGDNTALLARLMARGKLQRSAAASHLLLSLEGKPYRIDIETGGRLRVSAIKIGPLLDDIDLAAERHQIYEETVRRFRDYFYDSNLHGVDWMAKAAYYRRWLPGIRSRADLDFVLAHLVSEIGNSHISITAPPAVREKSEQVGLLGADLVSRNGEVIVSRILSASSWDGARSPLANAGIAEGDAIQAIAGKPVTGEEDIYRLLVGTAGKNTQLTYLARRTGQSRAVMVRPIETETWLRQRAWVEQNLRHVSERSHGRIAYVYQSDTSEGGVSEFVRYFYPQANREAIIVDDRFNRGGSDPDYQLDTLGRTRFLWYTRRALRPLGAPTSVIQGPKVLIVNAEAHSGGDVYPYEYKARGLGPVIGKRPWGGVNGFYRGGEPTQLIDGGLVTVPDLGSFSPAGEPVLENEGFAPDEVVDIYPADYAAARDPQLDRAIDTLMNRLAGQPDASPPRSLQSVGASR